jgi:hypothetical protein
VVWHDDRTKDRLKNRDGKPKLYHLLLTYVKGSPKNKWDAQPAVAHYTAADPAGHWEFKGLVPELDHAMDPHLVRHSTGKLVCCSPLFFKSLGCFLFTLFLAHLYSLIWTC